MRSVHRALGLALMGCVVAYAAPARQPNILVIVTDDQDWHMQSLEHMPFVQSHLIDQGTLYPHHYCTVAVCCPSRATLWTGRAAHNTNVTDLVPPYGGYPKVVKEGINDNYLPLWLQAAGYDTYYVGKLWNAHSVTSYNQPFVNGFNGSDFLLDPYTYRYYNAAMSRNGEKPLRYEGQYSPDLTAEKAKGFLEEALGRPERPWFLVHAPIAPHGDFNMDGGVFRATAPGMAERHKDLFADYVVPRDESFNPETQSGVSWVKNLPLLDDDAIEYGDEYQRRRLRSLQAVDESVDDMVGMLEVHGQLDNTYIFYTTDNGYHISQHRMLPGKTCGFETDVHIPLVVRGPGVAAGRVSDAVTSHVDIASTIVKIAGAPPIADTDGAPIPLTPEEEEEGEGIHARSEHVAIEYWGPAFPEGELAYPPEHGTEMWLHNTYKAVRVIGRGYNVYYAVWCTNEAELYNLEEDPGQVRNLLDERFESAAAGFRIGSRTLQHIIPRLDSLMIVLKSCKGETCVAPWRKLHPHGGVDTLVDSLAAQYDRFYDAQPRVRFERCARGHLLDAEGPMNVHQYRGGGGGGKELGMFRWMLDSIGIENHRPHMQYFLGD